MTARQAAELKETPLQPETRGERIVIFGGKGGGEVTAEYVAAAAVPRHVLGFLNDEHAEGAQIAGYSVLGKFSDWARLPADVLFNAPIHRAKEAQQRLSVINNLNIPEERWISVIHTISSIATSAVIRTGASIGAFSYVGPGAVLGRHVAIRPGAYVAHDTELGDFVFVGPGAVIAGYCTIGTGAFIGANASIKERTKVGRLAIIAHGASVVRDVEACEIVAGNPARRVGRVPRLGSE